MGKRKDRITSLARLKRRCIIADRSDPDCCWIWNGAVGGNGSAAVWVVIDGKGRVMSAPAAAAVLSGKELPPGGRSWASCTNRMCGNPLHACTGTFAEWGAFVKEHQLWVGNAKNIAAAKARGRERSKLTMELAREIRNSPLPPSAEARRFTQAHGIQISKQLVHHVRVGRRWAEPNPFDGLGAR